MEEMLSKRNQRDAFNHFSMKKNGRGVDGSLNAIDRFVARLLAQKLRRYMEPEFCENSFAYQEGKGVAAAVEKACQYINEGYTIVAEWILKAILTKYIVNI